MLAAVLKATGLQYDLSSISELDWRLGLLLILLEAVLGIWILSQFKAAGSWLAAWILFAAFTVITTQNVFRGATNCGCFGSIELHPGWSLLLDIVVLFYLTLHPWICNTKSPRIRNRILEAWKPFLLMVGSIIFLLGGSVAVLLGVFGTAEGAIASLRGDDLYATSMVTRLPSATPGSTIISQIPIRNDGDREVRIIAGTSNCTCTTTGNLPITIPAHSTVEVPVQVHLPEQLGSSSYRVTLMLDHPTQRRMRFTVRGTSVSSP